MAYTPVTVATSNNSIVPGDIIDGKYTIGRVIGSGGMGTVYEAVHADLDRRVALKVLHSKYAKSPKIVERFHQEARFAGSIEHDNICRVIDHGTSADGAPYLVMPLLSGQSLGTLLAEGTRPSLMRIIDIACQTLQALAAAHDERVVHRDLKPDNIFITRVGDRDDFVKLLDFGISKVLEKNTVSELTVTGMVLGTAFYLAPEQARGSKKIDHRVDIYAMGVILYEALTGVRPFEGDTYNEVVFKIAGEPVKPPRALNPAISRAVERIILKAMAIDPGARFATAREMCEALEQAMIAPASPSDRDLMGTLADTEAEGARPTFPGSAAGRGRRRVAAIAFLAAAALLGILFWLLSDAEPVVTDVDPAVLSGRSEADEAREPPRTTEAPAASKGLSAARDRSADAEVQAVAPPAQSAPRVDAAPDPPPEPGPRPRRRPRQQRREGDVEQKNFIPGRFNTKFYIEEK